jgi:hypothetical protein
MRERAPFARALGVVAGQAQEVESLGRRLSRSQRYAPHVSASWTNSFSRCAEPPPRSPNRSRVAASHRGPSPAQLVQRAGGLRYSRVHSGVCSHTSHICWAARASQASRAGKCHRRHRCPRMASGLRERARFCVTVGGGGCHRCPRPRLRPVITGRWRLAVPNACRSSRMPQGIADPSHGDQAPPDYVGLIAQAGQKCPSRRPVGTLQRLAEAEPQIRQIDTGNAASSRHMISINEALGFRVHGPGWVTYDKTISPERIAAPA